MYAKNIPVPPKFDYPYQEQQKYSGAFVTSDEKAKVEKLSQDTLRQIEEYAGKLKRAE